MDPWTDHEPQAASSILDVADQSLVPLCCAYCRVNAVYGLLLQFDPIPTAAIGSPTYFQDEPLDELRKACPPLAMRLDANDCHAFGALASGRALLTFGTRDLQQQAYWSVVGADGPAPENCGCTNFYRGPCSVYALTINADGHPENENT